MSLQVPLRDFPSEKVHVVWDSELKGFSSDDRRMKQATDLSSSFSSKTEFRRTELREAVNDDLSVDQTKLQFLANMNHELRTPLTGLMGAAELLGMTSLTEEQRHYLQIFRNSSEQMLGIVNDVLDYSKMATGQLRLSYSCFDLRSLLHESFLHFEPYAQRKGLSLAYNIDASVPKQFYGDEQRLSQLLGHLVSNAIKFTSRGFVEIDIGLEGEFIFFKVRDSGIGIAVDQLDRIFDSFFQVDSSHSRSYGGTGLGLAICKYLTLLMGGDIVVSSESRKGSEFHVRLPYLNSILGMSLAKSKLKRLPRKILLVEDNEINQALILLLFNKRGIPIDIACDGQEGLDLHRKNHYDLIFMDMQMPVMNGVDATRAIREFDSQVYIVALTETLAPDVEAQCAQNGMNDCFAKPLDQGRLENLLGMFACH